MRFSKFADILSDILSGMFCGIYSVYSDIPEFYLASMLTFSPASCPASLLAFYLAFFLTTVLAVFLACLPVRLWCRGACHGLLEQSCSFELAVAFAVRSLPIGAHNDEKLAKGGSEGMTEEEKESHRCSNLATLTWEVGCKLKASWLCSCAARAFALV